MAARRKGEDVDAPRRLYYVAMTRARETLALAQLPGSHPIKDALLHVPSVLRREAHVNLPPAGPELSRRYRRLSLGDVFLSFAGYKAPRHDVHRAIAQLSPGDVLKVQPGPHRWEMVDSKGTVVGQLYNGFTMPDGMLCKSATVMAIVTWDRERSEVQYRQGLRCDAWEVVVPELILEPLG